eukprot:gb/GEZN01032827.1/.p1 GENE.gb/GEZN01032827.1/~~gb/GEZN01032827.1/.p1  ORF type:complete len:122 (+),score=5.14 gb/GEZN01032827.1/:29-367(+)
MAARRGFATLASEVKPKIRPFTLPHPRGRPEFHNFLGSHFQGYIGRARMIWWTVRSPTYWTFLPGAILTLNLLKNHIFGPRPVDTDVADDRYVQSRTEQFLLLHNKSEPHAL